MTTQICPSCGEVGASDASWCEACGGGMGPPCVDCGADHEHIVEGYCGQCGRKQPGERDHLSEDLGVLAAATDRGKRHHRNEDAFGIGIVGDSFVTVVCDGVSTTDDPQEASLAAATAARDFLVAALEEGASDLEAALVEATEKAQAAAAAVPRIVGGVGPASTTFVASIVATGADVVRSWTAWLGDSRAYWVHENGVDQLTTDDSWALDQVASGAMTEADANGDRRAQSITRWLGADAVKVAPSIHVAEHDPGGSLLLCSDGLWKYVPEPAELLALLQSQKAGTTLELAEALVAFANESGGHDNTTVVIVRTDVGNDVKTAM